MKHELIGKRIKGITRDGEEYEGVVVALDFEKGITIDTVEPEKMQELGYDMSEDNHTYCLNAKESPNEYKEEFKHVLEQIRLGTLDERKSEELFPVNFLAEMLGDMSSCAFE